MKKIVGTILAASLALTAFAAEPAANFVMADFTGNAEFGWKAELADSDNVKTGMFNKNEASIKFGIVDAGDKSTTGDGIWGELKIKADATSVTNNNDLTKLFPVAAVDTAKIHFVDGDFSAALNILEPSLKYGAFAVSNATGATAQTGEIGKDFAAKAGFGLEFAMKDMFAFNIKLEDNQVAKDKKFGLAFDAALLAIKPLTAKVYGTFNFDMEYTGLAAEAAYKFDLGSPLYVTPAVAYTFAKEGDKDAENYIVGSVLFGWGASGLKPEFTYLNNASDKFNEGVSVAVDNNFVFGKGTMTDPAVEPTKKYINTTNLTVGAYDQSLMKLLGVDGLTLKTGIQNKTTFDSYSFEWDAAKDGKYVGRCDKLTIGNEFLAGIRLDAELDPVYISLGGDMKVASYSTTSGKVKSVGSAEIPESYLKPFKDLYEKTTTVDPETSFAWSAKVGTKKIVDNTDIYVLYAGEYNGATEKLDKNDITIGTKIFF